jgi:hypothetical protein
MTVVSIFYTLIKKQKNMNFIEFLQNEIMLEEQILPIDPHDENDLSIIDVQVQSSSLRNFERNFTLYAFDQYMSKPAFFNKTYWQTTDFACKKLGYRNTFFKNLLLGTAKDAKDLGLDLFSHISDKKPFSHEVNMWSLEIRFWPGVFENYAELFYNFCHEMDFARVIHHVMTKLLLVAYNAARPKDEKTLEERKVLVHHIRNILDFNEKWHDEDKQSKIFQIGEYIKMDKINYSNEICPNLAQQPIWTDFQVAFDSFVKIPELVDSHQDLNDIIKTYFAYYGVADDRNFVTIFFDIMLNFIPRIDQFMRSVIQTYRRFENSNLIVNEEALNKALSNVQKF